MINWQMTFDYRQRHKKQDFSTRPTIGNVLVAKPKWWKSMLTSSVCSTSLWWMVNRKMLFEHQQRNKMGDIWHVSFLKNGYHLYSSFSVVHQQEMIFTNFD